MRHGSSGRKSRNRGNNRRGGNNRMQVFDSNGPDVRIRGTAHQVHEKYMALAKDATGAGDIILAESYLQHAEHYQRVINMWEDHVETDGSGLDAENAQENSSANVSENNEDNRPQRRGKRPPTQKASDDLGLPESIVGKKDVSEKADADLQDA